MTRIELTGTTEHGDGVQVELVLDEPCVQGCGGRGMVEHPLWAEFNAADRAIAEERGVAHTLTEEHRAWEREWWGERGYRVTLDVGFDRNLPPEEVECPACGGRGAILTEAGRELAGFVRREQVRP